MKISSDDLELSETDLQNMINDLSKNSWNNAQKQPSTWNPLFANPWAQQRVSPTKQNQNNKKKKIRE